MSQVSVAVSSIHYLVLCWYLLFMTQVSVGVSSIHYLALCWYLLFMSQVSVGVSSIHYLVLYWYLLFMSQVSVAASIVALSSPTPTPCKIACVASVPVILLQNAWKIIPKIELLSSHNYFNIA